MGQLVGLRGMDGPIKAVIFQKPKEVEAIVEAGHGAITAGYNGCIHIWKDKDKKFCCEATRYQRSIDFQQYDEIQAVIGWIKGWLPKIK